MLIIVGSIVKHMKKGNFLFNKNLALLVNTKGQFVYSKRQYMNIRYKRTRLLISYKKIGTKKSIN